AYALYSPSCRTVLGRVYRFLVHGPPPTQLSPLSLHHALPISWGHRFPARHAARGCAAGGIFAESDGHFVCRLPLLQISRAGILQIGRAHSELQSLTNLVCRLLLETKTKMHGLPNPLTTHTYSS